MDQSGEDNMVTVEQLKTYWSHLAGDQEAKIDLKSALSKYSMARRFGDFHEMLFQSMAGISKSDKDSIQMRDIDVIDYAKCLNDQPLGQSIVIWRQFLRQKNKPKAWFQLFSVFLRHVHQSDSISTKSKCDMSKCIEDTKDKLSRKLKKNSLNTQWLMVCLSFGELLTLHDHQYSSSDMNDENYCDSIKYWSLDHLGLSSSVDWKKFFKTPGHEALKIQFLIQKLKIISSRNLLCPDTSSEEKTSRNNTCVDSIIKQIMKMLQTDGTLLNQQVIETIVPLLNTKQLSKITPMIGSHLMSSPDIKHIPLLLNNQSFQTSIITWIISLMGENIKDKDCVLYSILTKLGGKYKTWSQNESSAASDGNAAWDSVLDAIKDFESLTCGTSTGVSEETMNSLLLMIKNCVALDSMPPLNQTRIFLVMSSLLISCDAVDNDSLIDCLTEILDGFRSIWLFSLMKPKIYLGKFIESMSDDMLNYNVFREFCKIVVVKIFSDLKRKLLEMSPPLKTLFGKKSSSSRVEFYLKLLFIRQFKSWSDQKSLKPNDAKVRQEILKTSVKKVVKDLCIKLKEANGTRTSDWLFLDAISTLIESYPKTVLKKPEVKSLISESIDLHLNNCHRMGEVSSKFLQLMSEKKSIFRKYDMIPEDFEDRMIQKMMESHVNEIKPDKKRKMDSEESSEASPSKKSKIVESVNREIMNESLVLQMITSCDETEIRKMIQMIMDVIKKDCDVESVNRSIMTGIILLRKCSQQKSSPPIPLNDLLQLLSQKIQDVTTDSRITTSIIKLLSCINRTKCSQKDLQMAIDTLIVSTQHLGCLRQDPLCFCPIFLEILSFLHEILVDSQKLNRFNTSCQIITNRLFKFIIGASASRFDYSLSQLESLETCVRRMDRILSLWCSIKGCDEATGAHILAIYITEVQRVQLNPQMKEILAPSICRLIKKCCESDAGNHHLEMIHSRLNQAGKEFLRILMNDYENNYRFKGHV